MIILDKQKQAGGVTQTIGYEESGDKLIIAHTQDCTAIINANKIKQKDGTNGYSKSREIRHVATIPAIWLIDMMNKHGGVNLLKKENGKLLRKCLNDPDYSFLKTIPGKV
jgi:hypothetical protein